MTVEVAGVFGKEKAGRWMTSFAISIIESIFLSQPIKVIGVGVGTITERAGGLNCCKLFCLVLHWEN